MVPAADFDQTRRQVFECAQRLLRQPRDEFPLTHAEIASDTGIDEVVVLEALRSLRAEHLDVSPMEDWSRATVDGVISDRF